MLKLKLYIVMTIVASWLLSGCTNSKVPEAMVLAEELMEEQPDSALILLESVDGGRLSGEPRARYALLLSQAYDKNYIDLTDDSLISLALDYYLNTDDTYRTMLGYHYRAAVNRNAGYYESSLSSGLKAYDLAVKLNDDLNKSRIASLISRLYTVTYNSIEAISWEEIALHYAKKVGRPAWIYNGYRNIGEGYIAIGEFSRGLEYADSAFSVYNQDDIDILNMKYHANYGMGNFVAADSIFKVMEVTDGFVASAVLLSLQCGIDVKVLDKYPVNYNDDVLQEHVAAQYIAMDRFAAAHDFDSALKVMKDITRVQNDEIITLTHANLLRVQADHETEKVRIQQLQAKLNRQKSIGAILLCLLIIIVLIFSLVFIRNRHARQTLQQENDLLYLTREIQNVRQKLEETNSIAQQSSLALLEKFAWVENLGNIYMDASITQNKEKILYKNVSELLNAARNDNFASKIEETIRSTNPAIMEGIDSLGLIKSEREVLIYLYAHFSIRIISLLTDKTRRAIYNLKARLKAKLSELDTPTSRTLLNTLF